MPQRESVRFAGDQLLRTLLQFGQELQKRQQLEQFNQALQGATQPVFSGGGPVDFNRNVTPPNAILPTRSVGPGYRGGGPGTSPIENTQIGSQLDLRALLPVLLRMNALGNEPSQRYTQGLLATQPKHQFINQEGGGLQMATIPPIGEPTVKQITPSQFRPGVDPQDKKIAERIFKSVKYVKYRRPDGTDYEIEVGPVDKSSGGSDPAKLMQLNRLYDQFTKIEADLKDLEVGLYRNRPLKELMPETEIAVWLDKEKKRLTGDLTGKSALIKKLEAEVGVSTQTGRPDRSNNPPEVNQKIRVRRKSDGQTGTINSDDFDESTYERIG